MSIPEGYRAADFQILGEAEGIIDKFVEAWTAGVRNGVFEADKFQADVTKSPILAHLRKQQSLDPPRRARTAAGDDRRVCRCQVGRRGRMSG